MVSLVLVARSNAATVVFVVNVDAAVHWVVAFDGILSLVTLLLWPRGRVFATTSLHLIFPQHRTMAFRAL